MTYPREKFLRRSNLMYQKTIVVLESNAEVLKELKTAIEEQTGNRVVYAGDDGEVGIRQILQLKPDLVVVGMFLKGCDGCVVIREVIAANLLTKFIATGVSSDPLMERAMSVGAEYYLVKPFTISSALDRIEEILTEVKEKPSGADYYKAKKRATTIDEKISEIFIAIGIPPHIKGYSYLREGIKMTVDNPAIINNVTKALYPGIAKKFITTPSKVERAIRHAIEVAWNRGRTEAISAIFGTRIYLGSEKPTNSEFIALVADKLILEKLM